MIIGNPMRNFQFLIKNIDKSITMGSDSPFGEPFYGKDVKDEIEKCVRCGADTPYTINTHIDMRKNYVEGAGQLCEDCYNKIYK